ncbi:unnamed protein product [Clonostachys byssicola]|uniref:Yeast cell wall synthesis Kre9/Knh1-like N-terminal domain-containing protein n=1 Tax=Clonostachys byssicola TaxID=160290 RepID=A0A9N9XYI0_9HYPO|nr:unnamed protein product [Clonostachys byssicola]
MHPRSFLTVLSTLGFLTAGIDARRTRRRCSSVFPSSSSALGPEGSSSTIIATPTSGFVTSTRLSSASSTSVVESTSAVESTTAVVSTTSAVPSTTSASAQSTTKPSFDPIYTPTNLQQLTFGQSLDITWGYDAAWAGKIDIKLIGGADSNTLVPLGTIVSGIENSLGKYTWTLDQDWIGSYALYGITITFEDGKTVQYSMPFKVSGGGSTTPTNPTNPPVFNPIYTPTNLQQLTCGQVIDITWGYDSFYAGQLEITLIGGTEQNLQFPLGVIATVDNSLGKYSWTINNNFVGANNIYGLSVKLSGTSYQQYSMPFHITGCPQ